MANTQQAPELKAKGERFKGTNGKAIRSHDLETAIWNGLGERDMAMAKVMFFLTGQAQDGSFKVAEKTICDRCKMSDTGYKNARKKLVEKGWIEHKDGYIMVLYDNIYNYGKGSTENTPKIIKNLKGSTENTPLGSTENTPLGSTENTHNNISNNIINNINKETEDSIVGDTAVALLQQVPSSVVSVSKQEPEDWSKISGGIGWNQIPDESKEHIEGDIWKVKKCGNWVLVNIRR